MKTTTNLFKLFLLLFGISLLLWNCEDENAITPEAKKEQRRIDVSIVSFEHFRGINAKALENIFPRKKSKSDDNTLERIVESSEYGFFINEDRVQIIEKENYTTYTFNVLRDSVVDGELENYMYKEFNDGSYKQFLLTYYYAIDENGIKIFDTTDMKVELIEDESLLNRNNCHPHFIETVESTTCTYRTICTGTPGNHELGDSCNCTGYNGCFPPGETCIDEYSYTFDDCSGGNTGGDNPGDPNNPDIPPTGGGNTGGNTNPDNTDAVPLDEEPEDYVQNIENCINGPLDLGGSPDNTTLTDDMIAWLNGTAATDNATLREIRNIDDFLDNNNCSEEAQAFTLLAAEAMMDDGDVDFEDKIVLDSTFVNNEKVKCVYNKLKKLSRSIFSDIINNHFDSSKVAHIKFEVKEIPNHGGFEHDAKTYPFFNGGNENRFYKIRLDTDFVEEASSIEIAFTLIHEAIHAELLDRCIESGLILSIAPNGNYTFPNFPVPTFSLNSAIFNSLTLYYKNLGSGNPQWNHDQFNVFDYRTKLAQNLLDVHPELDDINNPLINQINDDSNIFSLEDYMNFLAWESLEETVEFSNLTIDEQNKKDYVLQFTKDNYNKNCE